MARLPELLAEALEVTRNVGNEYYLVEALSALAPQLPELWSEALEVTRSIHDESSRAVALKAAALSVLAPQLPEHLLSDALDMARSINYESFRAKVLIALAPQLPELWPEALELTRKIDQFEQAEVFRALVPHLPEALFPEALDVTRNINDEQCRAEALIALAPQLPESLVSEVLDITHSINNGFARASALSAYLSRFEIAADEPWRKTLRIISMRQRQALIADLPKLESSMVALGGRAALEGALQAMREVSSQWK